MALQKPLSVDEPSDDEREEEEEEEEEEIVDLRPAHQDDESSSVSSESTTGSGGMNPPVFSRTLSVSNAETVVVVASDTEIVSTADAGVSYCLFGSRDHEKALQSKLHAVEQDRQTLLAQQAELVKKLAELRKESVSLRNQEEHLEQIRQKNSLIAASNRVESADIELKGTIVTADHVKHSFHAEIVKEFGERNLVAFIDADEAEDTKLFKLPRVRQFFEGNKLFREYVPRRATTVELFFDLAMLAAFLETGHLLTDIFDLPLTYGEISIAIQLFIVTYMPIWRLWMDVHIWLNHHDNGDITIKFLTYMIMCLIIVGMGASAEYILSGSAVQYGGALLCSKAILALYNLVYAWLIPHFRTTLLLQAVSFALTSIAWFPLLSPDTVDILAVLWAANIIEIAIQYAVNSAWFVLRKLEAQRHRELTAEEQAKKARSFHLALNIEHFTERLGLFTILVLGEQIVAISVTNMSSSVSLAQVCSALGLLIAFCYQWTYFELSASCSSIHPLRNSRHVGQLFTLAHMPLHMSIIASAHGLESITQYYQDEGAPSGLVLDSVSQPELPMAARWIYCGSLAIAMFIMGVIAMMYESKDKPDLTRLSKRWRVGARLVTAIIIVFLPFATDLSPMGLMSVIAAVSVAHFAFEIYTQLKRPKAVMSLRSKIIQRLNHSQHTTAPTPPVAAPATTDETKTETKKEEESVHVGRSIRMAHKQHRQHHHHQHAQAKGLEDGKPSIGTKEMETSMPVSLNSDLSSSSQTSGFARV